MARIRSIKPEFFSSEQIVECSPIARLLFIGMWCFCDDGGVHPASTKTLKMRVFPGDDISTAQIEACIGELIENGLLESFEHEDLVFLRVTGWSKHQKIDRPTFKYPQNSTTARRELVEDSSNARRELVERSPPEGKGEERNGKEVNPLSEQSLSEIEPPPADSTDSARADETGLPVPIPPTTTPPPVQPPTTTAGELCARIRKTGLPSVNPAHPRLLALLAAGVTPDEIEAAAIEAKDRGKGFAYALGVAEGRRQDASRTTANLSATPPPTTGRTRPPTLSEQRDAASIALTGRKPTTHEPPAAPRTERDITGEATRIA